jgi:hypothetical protein
MKMKGTLAKLECIDVCIEKWRPWRRAKMMITRRQAGQKNHVMKLRHLKKFQWKVDMRKNQRHVKIEILGHNQTMNLTYDSL